MDTVDRILQWFEEMSKNNTPLDPLMYLEAGTKLQALKGGEDDKRIDLEYQVAKLRDIYLEQEKTSSKAEIKVKSNPIYKEWKMQEARCNHIKDMVSLSKHWARIKNEQMRSGL